jgi:hypothetical protein
MGIGSWFQRKKDQVLNIPKKIIDPVFDFTTDAVKGVINFVMSPFTGGFDIPDSSIDTAAAIDQATTVDFTPSNTSIPVCYGRYVERGVKNIFIDTGGDKNQYLYMCGVIGLGMTQDDNFGSRLWNLMIDDQVCDITTIPTPESITNSLYTTNTDTEFNNISTTGFRGDGFPRFGGHYKNRSYGRQPLRYKVTTGRFKDRVEFQLFDGSDNQPISDLLKETDKWSGSNMNLAGVQYIALKFTWTSDEIKDENGENLTNPFQGLPRVVVVAPGKNVPKLVRSKNSSPGYEFDTDVSTSGDTIPNMPTPADWSVTFAGSAYSHTATRQDGYDVSGNPVEILLDYMLNDRYGAGISLTKIDQNSFVNAAVACGRNRVTDATTSSNFFASNNYSNIYTGSPGDAVYPNIKLQRDLGKEGEVPSLSYENSVYYRQFVINTGATHLQNINRILTSIGAMMPYVNGKFKLQIENAGTPDNSYEIPSDADLKASHTFTFTDDNIVGGMSFTGGALNNTFNQIKINYTDITQRSQNNSVVWPPKTDAQYTTFKRQDNDIDLIGNVTNAGIINAVHATHYAKTLVLKSRQRQQISFKTTESATNIVPGDLIRVNSTVLSIDHMFRINSLVLIPDGEIEINAFRHYPNSYDFDDTNLFDNLLSRFRFLQDKLKKKLIISPVKNVFSAPQGLTARLKNVNVNTFDQANRSNVLLKWRDGNINAGTNSYEIQLKKSTDAEEQFVSVGTTRNEEFEIDTAPYVGGQKLNVRVRAIANNGTFSSFASTDVTSKPFLDATIQGTVFPYFKKFADDTVSLSSGPGSGNTTVTTRTTTQTQDTGEI